MTVTARRWPHLDGGINGVILFDSGVSGLVLLTPPPRSSHTRFVKERGLLKRRDL